MTEMQPGMRLEAVDRKNPNLVCVATIVATSSDNQLHIHFDGWGKSFDYYANRDSTDLHPIGWMEANMKKNELQAPKGHDGKFKWKKYLKDNTYLPVPYSWFTQKQTGDTTRELEDSLIGELNGGTVAPQQQDIYGQPQPVPENGQPEEYGLPIHTLPVYPPPPPVYSQPGKWVSVDRVSQSYGWRVQPDHLDVQHV